jgi:hypothetical protein
MAVISESAQVLEPSRRTRTPPELLLGPRCQGFCQSVCVLPCYQDDTEPLRLRFEHVVGPPDGRLRVSGELPALLGFRSTSLDEALEAGLPVGMALTKPNAGDPVATRSARLSAILASWSSSTVSAARSTGRTGSAQRSALDDTSMFHGRRPGYRAEACRRVGNADHDNVRDSGSPQSSHRGITCPLMEVGH